MKWEPLKTILYEIYSREEIQSDFPDDETYLRSAYHFTEKKWHEQVQEIDQIKLMLFSEAPLFGEEKAYIYNPNYGFTAFFHFNDLRAVYDKNLKGEFNSKVEKKEYFIDKLNDAGILVLDIFPYAFNPKITSAINYQSMTNRLYSEIFDRTLDHFFFPKLSIIQSKITQETIFTVRYKKLLTKTGPLLKTALRKKGLEIKEIVSLHGSNMSMDRDYLAKIYSEI